MPGGHRKLLSQMSRLEIVISVAGFWLIGGLMAMLAIRDAVRTATRIEAALALFVFAAIGSLIIMETVGSVSELRRRNQHGSNDDLSLRPAEGPRR